MCLRMLQTKARVSFFSGSVLSSVNRSVITQTIIMHLPCLVHQYLSEKRNVGSVFVEVS